MKRGKRRVFIRPRADVDIDAAFGHLSEGSPDAAARFLDALQDALVMLSALPEIGTPCEFSSGALQGLRMWRVAGFEVWLIFYGASSERIDIVRILHGSRDVEAVVCVCPGYCVQGIGTALRCER